MGHVLSGNGIRPDPKKIPAIREWEALRMQKKVRSFLGLANYYRKFIKNFSKIASPLSNLLGKEGQLLKWDEAYVLTNSKCSYQQREFDKEFEVHVF